MRCPASVYDSAPEPASATVPGRRAPPGEALWGEENPDISNRRGYPLAQASARRKRKKEGAAMRRRVFVLLVALALVLLLASDAR